MKNVVKIILNFYVFKIVDWGVVTIDGEVDMLEFRISSVFLEFSQSIIIEVGKICTGGRLKLPFIKTYWNPPWFPET